MLGATAAAPIDIRQPLRCGKSLCRATARGRNVSPMYPTSGSVRRGRPGRDVDCAECPAARRCWGDPLPSGAGFLAYRLPRLEPGARLIAQGERFEAVHLVVNGCLTVREAMLDGTERVVGFRLPGELVGLEGWMNGAHPHTAAAACTTTVCRLKWPVPRRAGDAAAFLERLLLKAVDQLQSATRPWAGLPADERVAAFVEDFAQRRRGPEASGGPFALPMTRADIGSYLGLAEETVVRALARLKRARRLDVEGRMVALCG